MNPYYEDTRRSERFSGDSDRGWQHEEGGGSYAPYGEQQGRRERSHREREGGYRESPYQQGGRQDWGGRQEWGGRPEWSGRQDYGQRSPQEGWERGERPFRQGRSRFDEGDDWGRSSYEPYQGQREQRGGQGQWEHSGLPSYRDQPPAGARYGGGWQGQSYGRGQSSYASDPYGASNPYGSASGGGPSGGSFGSIGSYGQEQQPWMGQRQNYGGSSDARRAGGFGGGTTYADEGRAGYKGKGPKGYSRSDDRIREEVCDILMDHDGIDASEVEVKVKDGEVVLEGTIEDRRLKFEVERLCDAISGVKDVRNNLKVQGRERERGASSAQAGNGSSGEPQTQRSAASSMGKTAGEQSSVRPRT